LETSFGAVVRVEIKFGDIWDYLYYYFLCHRLKSKHRRNQTYREERNENALSSNKFDWKLPLKTSERHLESSDLAKMFN